MKKQYSKLKRTIATHLQAVRIKNIVIGVMVALLGIPAIVFSYANQPKLQQTQHEKTSKQTLFRPAMFDSSNATPADSNNDKTNSVKLSPSQSSPPRQSESSEPKKICKTVPVPYETIRRPDHNLNVGQEEISSIGINGINSVCTNNKGEEISSEMVFLPMDEIIYYGTFTYEEALSDAKAYCDPIYAALGSYGSTDRRDCIIGQMQENDWYNNNGQWFSY